MAMKHLKNITSDFHRAAQAIQNAKALFINAAGGMNIDSGLPQLSRPRPFWQEFPALEKRGLGFKEINNPKWFESEPELAWGFFGHRFNLYKNSKPHEGFRILKKWCDTMSHGFFVYTSNVDNHFQRSGFPEEKIIQARGSIMKFQCVLSPAYGEIWDVPENQEFIVDQDLRLTSLLPEGPPEVELPLLARPNIKMLKDRYYLGSRAREKEKDLFALRLDMMKEGGIPFVVIEIGAPLDDKECPVRKMSEQMATSFNTGTLIRINTLESKVPNGDSYIALPIGAEEALTELDSIVKR